MPKDRNQYYRFTARNLPGLIAKNRPIPGRSRPEIYDTVVDGLGIRIGANSATWFVRYSGVAGRRRMSLGSCATADADRSLKGARERASDILHSAMKGDDPAASVQALKVAETVAELADQYIEEYASAPRSRQDVRPRKKSWKRDRQILDRDVKPRIGKMKAREVRKRDVIAMLDRVAARGLVQSDRTFEVVRRMFNWSVEKDIIEVSPCHGIKKRAKTNRRERVLTREEIARVWDRMPVPNDWEKDTAKDRADGVPVAKMHPLTAYALKLTLVTGQRPGDVAGMLVECVDRVEKLWTIPGEFYKSDQPHVVPLSSFALELLDDIEAFKAVLDKADKRKRSAHYSGSRFMFPSPRGEGHIAEPALAQAVNRCRETFETPQRWTPHDLRRTAGTNITGEQVGMSRFVLARVLGHADREVTSTYDRYAYLREKRQALDAWADIVREIVTSKAQRSNVVEGRFGV